jgi:hypothetical protein
MQPKSPTEQAIENPEANFDSPQSIVKNRQLSSRQKEEALKKWEEHARSLSVADQEGMTGGEETRLDEVKEAQAKLSKKTGDTN